MLTAWLEIRFVKLVAANAVTRDREKAAGFIFCLSVPQPQLVVHFTHLLSPGPTKIFMYYNPAAM